MEDYIENIRKMSQLQNDWFYKLIQLIGKKELSSDEWFFISISFAQTLATSLGEEAYVMMNSIMNNIMHDIFLTLLGKLNSKEEQIEYYKKQSEWSKLFIVMLFGFINSWDEIRVKIEQDSLKKDLLKWIKELKEEDNIE
jgi:hypothetical protein